MNKKKIKKIGLSFSLFSIGFATFIFTSSYNDDFISLSSQFHQSETDTTNYETQAKVDPLFTIHTIRKAKSDRNAINLLYLGNGYNSSQTKDFADFVYNNQIKGYFDGSAWASPPSTTFVKLFNNINVYSISPNFTGDDSQSNGKGFFSFYTTVMNSAEEIGYKKANVLNFDFTNNFADSNTDLRPNNITIVNKDSGARAITSYNASLISTKDINHTGMHELGHLIFEFEDEYNAGASSFGANADVTNDPNNIKWKEFLYYRDIGIFSKGGSNYLTIPTAYSKMNNDTYLNFKEVSEHQISKMINNELKLGKDLYIADPELFKYESKDEDLKKWSSKEEVFDENIVTANNKYLILRTVVDNWSEKTRKFKLQIKITDSNNNQKYLKESEEYIVQPNQKKGMVVKSDEKLTNLLKTDKIIGQIIDCETNKILATSRDRENKSLHEKNEDGSYVLDDNYQLKKLNVGNKMFNVNVEYKDKTTNKNIPNTYPVSLRYSDGDNVPIEKIIFNGYRFVESSDSDMQVQLNGKDENVTLYYEPLKYKTINLKLFDEDGKTVLQQKQVKVYEHQTFTPKNTDFWVQNLQTNKNSEIGWDYKVFPESNKSYNYDEISNNNITINYYKKPDNSNVILTKDVIGYKGEKMIFGYENIKFFTNEYLYEGNMKPTIYSNNVDINTPGEYEINYLSSDTTKVSQKVIIKDKQMPNDWTPNYLESEDRRVGSIFFILKDRNITRENYNQINKTNLLSMLKNPVTDNDKFKYSVESIEKKESGMLNFSLNITHNGETKKCTNTWTLFFNVDPNTNPNPPTPIEPDIPNKKEQKDISKALSDLVDSYKYYYTGEKITPEIVVYFEDEDNNNVYLTNGQDYEISYQNNVNAGIATITIYGIKNYYGSVKIDFQIYKAETNKITNFEIVDNKPIANSDFGKVKYQFCKNPNDENCLIYDEPTEIGTWYIQAYVDDSNNFNGSFSDWKTIEVKDLSNFNELPTNNPNAEESNKTPNDKTAIIVGVCVALIALVAIMGIAIWKIKSPRKKYKTIKK